MKKLVILTILGFAFAHCSSSTAPGDDSVIETDEFIINNNEDDLNQRVTDPEVEIVIDTTGSGTNEKRKGPKFSLTLKSEVKPPVINGQAVQATMVSSDGSRRAVVSYNMIGSPYIGAVDLAQIVGSGKITITSSISFRQTDVNAISYDDDYVYAATATADAGLRSETSASSLQSYRVRGSRFSGDLIAHQSLNSFVANSVKFYDDHVFVTTGNTGGLFVYDEDLEELIAKLDIPEARWVDANDDYVVVLAGDDDGDRRGTIIVLDPESFEVQARFPFPGAYTPEAKNTVELVDHLAFIAAGKEGVKVMDLTTGNIIAEVPLPDPAGLGLSDEVVSTNAVSVDDELLFISNGEAGIYVAEGSEEFDDVRPGESVTIRILGRLVFDDLQSANHVSYKGKIVTVAAGRGGIKSLELRYDD